MTTFKTQEVLASPRRLRGVVKVGEAVMDLLIVVIGITLIVLAFFKPSWGLGLIGAVMVGWPLVASKAKNTQSIVRPQTIREMRSARNDDREREHAA